MSYIAMSSLIVGNHVSKEGTSMHLAIRRDIEVAKTCGVTMKACQIFVVGPRNAKTNIDAEDIAGILKIVNDDGVSVFVHSSYMTNPWGNKAEFGILTARREMNLCDGVSSAGLVIHLAQVSAEAIAKTCVRILAPDPDGSTSKSTLWLEVESYRAGEFTYETVKSIAALIKELIGDGIDINRIGICIDTAHLWAAGTDIASEASAKYYLEGMLGLGVKLMFHLNDQIHPLGSGRDEHMALGYGTIWSRMRDDIETSGLAYILRTAAEKSIPIILERKEDKPKINGLPTGSNVVSDWHMIKRIVKEC